MEGEDGEARLVLHRVRQMIKTQRGEKGKQKKMGVGGWGGLVPLQDTRGSETQRSGTVGGRGGISAVSSPGLVWLQGVGIKGGWRSFVIRASSQKQNLLSINC